MSWESAFCTRAAGRGFSTFVLLSGIINILFSFDIINTLFSPDIINIFQNILSSIDDNEH